VHRRSFLLGSVVLAAAPLDVRAQSPKIPKVALLVLASTGSTGAAAEAMRARLRELGHIEGRTVAFEFRSADGRAERLPELAADLVARKVDVIITGGGNVSTAAARDATKTIPIVMGASVGAVEAGFVESLARPGGNITGLSVPREVGAKQVELLRELVPSVSRVAIFLRPSLSNQAQRARSRAMALELLRLTIDFIDVETPDDLPRAFAAARATRANAMLVGPDPLFFNERARLLEFARTARLPAIYPFRDFVDAGGLMSYSVDATEVYRSAARYVDRILKGAKPAELPVEQPGKYELVINQKTAKALGITIPSALVARADAVVE